MKASVYLPVPTVIIQTTNKIYVSYVVLTVSHVLMVYLVCYVTMGK